MLLPALGGRRAVQFVDEHPSGCVCLGCGCWGLGCSNQSTAHPLGDRVGHHVCRGDACDCDDDGRGDRGCLHAVVGGLRCGGSHRDGETASPLKQNAESEASHMCIRTHDARDGGRRDDPGRGLVLFPSGGGREVRTRTHRLYTALERGSRGGFLQTGLEADAVVQAPLADE